MIERRCYNRSTHSNIQVQPLFASTSMECEQDAITAAPNTCIKPTASREILAILECDTRRLRRLSAYPFGIQKRCARPSTVYLHSRLLQSFILWREQRRPLLIGGSDCFLLGEWFCDLMRPARPLAPGRAVDRLVLADRWLKLTSTERRQRNVSTPGSLDDLLCSRRLSAARAFPAPTVEHE